MGFPVGHEQTPVKHGFYSIKAIIREKLSEDERAAWDGAEVPPSAPPVLDTTFRELAVIRYRIYKWIAHERSRPGRKMSQLRQLQTTIDLLDRVMGKTVKALEVDARLREADASASSSEALEQYLRTLPSNALSGVLMSGELPRIDPVTGTPVVLEKFQDVTATVDHTEGTDASHEEGRESLEGDEGDVREEEGEEGFLRVE